MAASASLAFRSVRKQSISSSSSPAFDPTTLSASSMPLSPSPLPGMNANTNLTGASSADGGIGASLIGPGGAALMAGAPAAANTIANKQAVAGSSLYQACLNLRDRLYCVPGFGEAYLDEMMAGSATSPSTSSDPLSPTAGSPTSPTGAPIRKPSCDPVTQLWQCFRLGSPLCALFNTMNPQVELPVNPDANRSNANACKAQVMKFIIALKQNLGWDPDDIFTVSQLYLNDTNGFVKVVRTINRLLDVFEERGLLIETNRKSDNDDLDHPSDDRAKVIRELLTTERKYVQDLEVLQNYARALAQYDILPPDTLHNLFGNLNKLVDVQRRFLICVEENVRRPPDEQHFGHVFRTMEEDFAVYEPFCANYNVALDLINQEAHNLVRLKGMPSAQGCYLDPAYELPTFMIKPVQRICKYPLLLEQLLKKTSEDAPRYQELEDGLEVMRRITDKVNETSRLQENAHLVKELEWRVEDWKGHNIKTFGLLLLSDVFMVAKSDTEREYHVYLFEKILLCCKELTPAAQKKGNKNSSLLKQKHGATASGGKKVKTTLQLKGRIFINNVTGAFANSKMSSILGTASGQHALQVWWRGDVDHESFALKCKNEEQLKLWQTAINKLIDEVNMRRQQAAAQHYSQQYSLNMAGAGALGRRITQTSSHFPQTPLSEMAPVNPFSAALPPAGLSRTHSQASSYRYDDEDSEAGTGGSYYEPTSGRVTPAAQGRFSQPGSDGRERQNSLASSSNVDLRPRARTEDQDSSVMAQWRSHSPAVPPPMPRGLSYSSGADQQVHALRKASSSRQLRQPSGAAPAQNYPRPPRALDGGAVEYLDGSSDSASSDFRSTLPRGDSVASSMSRATSDSGEAHNRSRSASNPQQHNMYVLPPHMQGGPPPPMPKLSAFNGLPPAPVHAAVPNPSAGATVGVNGNGVDKRCSSSSISTSESGASGQNSRPQSSTAASSPVNITNATNATSSSSSATHRGSSNLSQPPRNPTNPNSNAVKLIVNYAEDKFVVVVLTSISFSALLDKVTKKIKLCSDKKTTDHTLRMRYIDEDGDNVLINDDEDVLMAFDAAINGEVEIVVT
ncbi:related to CDC24 - GTP/GDP exchange factor for Cdc42p [Melanopsichium pennsylvanicum]|uniref:Related to CDC24 - GTP/GDP exchange factor for Cdc42p n=2 Tax=Melanopsichium pennsylvanicum TaxID=63383 RepID=A0AAJ4XHC9_9BASI|nr:related to CDC24-GTP/GDP exchange factor for Cdc42p [Melanopsichium pennsylvanicum 4]SNX82107.1 related to CDC24 - GTP/GDP exchange factor for Cdc42p [Melanopsichium pennsylvanicum]